MLTPRLTQAHPAQGSVTLGPKQGEPGANFCDVGNWQFVVGEVEFALSVILERHCQALASVAEDMQVMLFHCIRSRTYYVLRITSTSRALAIEG